MKSRAILLAIALVVVAALGFFAGRWTAPAAGPAAPTTAPGSPYAVQTINKVIDGDTVEVSLASGVTERVRLLAIDTPERGHVLSKGARDALEKLLQGQSIHLEFETPGKLERDRYGRLLAYVIVDGKNANVEMVRQGWSQYVMKNGGERYKKELTEADEEARKEKRGIWAP